MAGWRKPFLSLSGLRAKAESVDGSGRALAPNQPKPELLPQPAQDLGEYLAEAFAGQGRHASGGAGSDKLQMTRIEGPVITGHGMQAGLETQR